jgi:hypothetical protein
MRYELDQTQNSVFSFFCFFKKKKEKKAMTGLAAMIALLAANAAIAADSAPIYLYGEADLAKLKASNPAHYARAEAIFASAEEICQPGKDEVYYAKFDAKNVRCQHMILKTSNPPRREIGFTLDDVRYVAVITLKDADARFYHVPRDPAEPVEPARK